MDCKRMREVLDLYVDRELSPEASAQAGLHLEECQACRRAERQLLQLRQHIRLAVNKWQLPDSLRQRVSRRSPFTSLGVKPAVAVLLASLLVGVSALRIPSIGGLAAEAIEVVAFHLDPPRALVLEGEVVCRDCELERMYGARAMCERKGHRGAVKTADGKIWNLMDNDVSDALIHNDALRGKRIRVRGTIYRRADALEVQSYEVL